MVARKKTNEDQDAAEDTPKPKQFELTREDAQQASGSSSEAFQLELITQTVRTLWLPNATDEKDHEHVMRVVFDTLRNIAPRDELEGMLAAQMVGTHNAAMECMRRAMLPDQTFEGREQNLKHATKLMGVYERQVAALDKHRGKGQQKITVEHVTVEAGGQAIVGNVTADGAGKPARRGSARP